MVGVRPWNCGCTWEIGSALKKRLKGARRNVLQNIDTCVSIIRKMHNLSTLRVRCIITQCKDLCKKEEPDMFLYEIILPFH